MLEVAYPNCSAVAMVERNPREIVEGTSLVWKGVYNVEHWRAGRLIHSQVCHNLLTTEGKRYMVDICMKGNSGNTYTFHTAWYVVLSSTNVAASADMNYDGIGSAAPQFSEFTTFKTPTTTRQQWVGTLDGSAASLTNNTSKAAFTIGSSPSTLIYGAGLVTNDTLGDHASGDYLLAYSTFAVPITVVEDDVVRIGITVSLT